jgi:hypothetical protein
MIAAVTPTDRIRHLVLLVAVQAAYLRIPLFHLEPAIKVGHRGAVSHACGVASLP